MNDSWNDSFWPSHFSATAAWLADAPGAALAAPLAAALAGALAGALAADVGAAGVAVGAAADGEPAPLLQAPRARVKASSTAALLRFTVKLLLFAGASRNVMSRACRMNPLLITPPEASWCPMGRRRARRAPRADTR